MNDSYITAEELRGLNADLDDNQLQKLAEELNATVEHLVGEEIIESLTPDDIEKLAELQHTASEEQLAEWIIEHVPDYPEIIEDNKAIVLGEYAETLTNEKEQ